MTTKQFLLVGALGLGLQLAPACGNTAQVTFNCVSVGIAPSSTTDFFGEESYLGFSAAEDGSVNNELTPVVDSPRTHGSVMLLQLPGIPEPFIQPMYLDVPDGDDANQNRVPDFWEVAKEVAGIESLGQFTLDDGMEVTQGTVAAVWSRAAGSTTGEVKIRLKTDFFDLTFRPTFEIWEYKGPLEYQLGETVIAATVDLARQGADGHFSGPIPLTRTSDVELHYAATEWTNELGETFQVTASTTLLLQRPGSHYSDELVFEDGIPSTPPTLEYALWLLDVVDPSDADGDQIPDLSDTPSGGTSKPVALEFRIDGDQGKLKITAVAGQQVTIEQAATLPASNWTEVRTLTLASDAEEIDVTMGGDGAGFWRARSP